MLFSSMNKQQTHQRIHFTSNYILVRAELKLISRALLRVVTSMWLELACDVNKPGYEWGDLPRKIK